MWALGLIVAARSRRFHAFKRRLLGSLRVAAYFLVVGGLALAVLSARAEASFREQSMALSKELFPLADVLEGATALRLNGEVINFSMTVLEKTSVKQVLDRVQTHCEKNPGPLARESLGMAERLPKVVRGSALVQKLLSSLAVARQESNGQGAVMCFTSDDSPPASDVAEVFERTNDLGAFGKLRYVMAGQGNAAQNEQHLTRVVTLWTEGHFRLDRLARPPSGDAPGSDSQLIPRPPGGVRVFSAETVGAPYSVRIYETNATAEELLKFYDERMIGWSKLSMAGYEQTSRAYVKNAMPLLVHLSHNESKTTVTLSEVGTYGQLEKMARIER